MKKKILAIREEFDHMGKYSGYDQLFKTLENDSSQLILKSIWKKDAPLNRWQTMLYSRLKKLINVPPFYTINSLAAELNAIRAAVANRCNILHISYLENNLGISRYLKGLGIKVIATAHQPPSWWKSSSIDHKLIQKLDKLIVLDSLSREYFSHYIDLEKIEMVRHGVNSEYFVSEEKTQKQEFNCLFTGSWLRDIDILTKVINNVTEKNKDVYFNLVYPLHKLQDDQRLKNLYQSKNVTFYHSISDGHLKSLYQQSDLFFIPLADSTANNGLLEAMSCGLPIITTSVGGVKDYMDKDFCFVNNSVDELADYIIELYHNRDKVLEMGTKARKYVEHYLNWQKIAHETLNIYHKL